MRGDTAHWTVSDSHLSMYAVTAHFSLFAGTQSLWMDHEHFLDILYPWCWSTAHSAEILNSVGLEEQSEVCDSALGPISSHQVSTEDIHVSCLWLVDFLLWEMCLFCWACLFVPVCVSVCAFVRVCACVRVGVFIPQKYLVTVATVCDRTINQKAWIQYTVKSFQLPLMTLHSLWV